MAEHRSGSGNFAENPEKASEAGKKGEQHSGGNFANDREKLQKPVKKVDRIATAADVSLNNLIF